MSFLLDTNVVSEWVKARPDSGVITWLAEADEDRIFLSVMTLSELRYGIERMPAGARQKRLNVRLTQELILRFEGRILPIDAYVADIWGRVMAQSQAQQRTVSVLDGFIAATAEVHRLTLVTRNISHFQVLGNSLLNPWIA